MQSRPDVSRTARRAARVELLSVDLLDRERDTTASIAALARRLEIGLGWHYLLDLAWLCRELGEVAGTHVLDAGAGTGILQWFLAERGVHVLSVDRTSRHGLPWIFRTRYRMAGLHADAPTTGPDSLGLRDRDHSWRTVVGSSRRFALRLARSTLARMSNKAPGSVTFLNADLADLSAVKEGTVDAVVSVSALEHNDLETLPRIVSELHRVLKAGGHLLATMAASRGHDWYHEPSRGWVLTPDTLRQLFGAPSAQALGFDDYDKHLSELTACEELRDGLAAFYFESGENGMPWGIWRPRYVPVGIKLTKNSVQQEALWC